jgi:hypothetical protein
MTKVVEDEGHEEGKQKKKRKKIYVLDFGLVWISLF